MRNLLIFVTKYNAFFLFLIFEISSLVIFVKYNAFQKASFINSANNVTGALYKQKSDLDAYMSLKQVNDSLAKANAALHNQLKSSFYIDTVGKHIVTDTVYKRQYEYIAARVINNSINKSNNYITINRGSKEGIGVGMGVTCNTGIVGKIVYVSDHLAVAQSLLNKDTRFSVMLAKDREIGYIRWGDDYDPTKGLLMDVSNNASPKVGEAVVTSGFSLFPEGIMVGHVTNLHPKGGGISLNMEVTFTVDFSRLQYVNVVDNKFANEQAGLEAREKKDE